MAYKIAGGTRWWQVRAGPGVEGEWIVMKKDWKEYMNAQAQGKAKGKEKEGKSEGSPADRSPDEETEPSRGGECENGTSTR